MTSTPAAKIAVAAGGVLAVGDDKVQRVLVAQARQDGLDGLASGLAHDIADEKNFHAGKFNRERNERHERKPCSEPVETALRRPQEPRRPASSNWDSLSFSNGNPRQESDKM